jgi:hypothetical protein
MVTGLVPIKVSPRGSAATEGAETTARPLRFAQGDNALPYHANSIGQRRLSY